eukprot:6175263-Pleurochrysis_carterae.AAC.2
MPDESLLVDVTRQAQHHQFTTADTSHGRARNYAHLKYDQPSASLSFRLEPQPRCFASFVADVCNKQAAGANTATGSKMRALWQRMM